MAIRETIGLLRHPFMDGDLEVHDDGTTYPKVRLAPAGVVLPYEIMGRNTYVYLLEQTRPECGDRPQLKTVGAYLRGEDPERVLKDALVNKAGIHGAINLRLIGRSIGYSVARAEIYCYATCDFTLRDDTTLPVGCSVKHMALSEAIDQALAGQVMDDCTTIPLLALYHKLASHS